MFLAILLGCVYVAAGQAQILSFIFCKLVNYSGSSVTVDQQNPNTVVLGAYRTLSIVTTAFNKSFGVALAPVSEYLMITVVMGCIVGAVLPQSAENGFGTLIGLGALSLGLYLVLMLGLVANVSSSIWTKANGFI